MELIARPMHADSLSFGNLTSATEYFAKSAARKGIKGYLAEFVDQRNSQNQYFYTLKRSLFLRIKSLAYFHTFSHYRYYPWVTMPENVNKTIASPKAAIKGVAPCYITERIGVNLYREQGVF